MAHTDYEYMPLFTKRYAGTFAIGVSTMGSTHAEVDKELQQDAVDRLRPRLRPHETLRLNPRGHIEVTLLGITSRGPRARLHTMIQSLVRMPFTNETGSEHVDVGSAWARLTGNSDVDQQRLNEVDVQAERALHSRDLSLRPAFKRSKPPRFRALNWLLIVLSFLLVFAVPLVVMLQAFQLGADISEILYFTVIAALGLMAVMQIAEGIAALRARRNPPPASVSAPKATALIAAYLPNEAGTIMSTLQSFLAQEYSGGLQVILAYNTPTDLPIESELRELAAQHSDLLVMRVEGSTSKAANVNAALAAIDGVFVGIFDADHQPMPGAFDRAWQWISNGAGIVQGHCVIRNGDDSFVARMVAIEFEQIYAVNHPGRARLQSFGIFGGANGFWRTYDLRRVRFQSAYLTEDIDSSVRSVRLGIPIVNDPGLLSRELAPYDLAALWKQRMRWAQGWFQVSLRHGHAVVVDKGLSPRQRLGLFMLLGWREAFPWVAALMWSVLVFAVLRDGHLPSGVILLALITVATAISGPLQVYFAYRLAAPEIRAHTSWWWQYLAFSVFFYQEWKNLIVRVAHLRQALRQQEWVVTPRGRTS